MKKLTLLTSIILLIAGCDKKNDDLVHPLAATEFPQVIRFDDEGDGDLEDADEFSFTLTLNDRPDPSGDEIAGTVIPLEQDVTVLFELKEWEGFNLPADYIKGVKAFYEIDDCTTSEDMGVDLGVQFDPVTKKGSVRFPKDVAEIEVVFETDEDFFDDGMLNEDERSLTLAITGLQNNTTDITFNKALEFKYEVLDKDGIHGDWELDHENPAEFNAFKELFGLVNDDIAALDADDVEKIELSLEYDEVKVVVELKETETVEECGDVEIVNKVIELEADLEELSTLASEGDLEFAGEIEQSDESIKEYVFKGDFEITGSTLTIELSGEYDDQETAELVLHFMK